ncbi:MAG: ABC transporter permease [Hyphomicrobiales bacterium]
MQYVIRRLTLLVPTIFLVMATVFVLIRLVPGDVVSLLVADQNVTTQDADRLREDLGLDRPVPVQFVDFYGDMLTGKFGNSIWTGESVLGEFGDRAPVTLQLALMAAIFSVLLGVPLGIISALQQDRWPDYILRSVAILGLSVPGFWLGTLAIVLPAVWWQYSPPLTYVSPFADPWDNFRQFVVPSFIMSLYLSSVLMRMTRSMMLEVMRQDYVRTARAKGVREGTVVVRHALRNGLIPVVTIFGTQFAVLLGGTVIFEVIFNLQGIGRYVFLAVSQRDYPVIQTVNVILALAVLGVNFLVDMSYAYLDPRTRAGMTS